MQASLCKTLSAESQACLPTGRVEILCEAKKELAIIRLGEISETF
jgi:hypothetical protein